MRWLIVLVLVIGCTERRYICTESTSKQREEYQKWCVAQGSWVDTCEAAAARTFCGQCLVKTFSDEIVGECK
ncbi:MAG TPA: hypothetical protein VHO25_22100 [Polyangiaceae bacterium]|nr:hypothetical protein [Polyangiaceae bacterium]